MLDFFRFDTVSLNAKITPMKTLDDLIKISEDVTKAIPSVIGADLLKQHRLALYFDACNGISYLEKVQ